MAKQKTCKFLFFLALFIFFLNALGFAGSYSGKNKNKSKITFIPPLILADYREGTLMTNTGGLSGGDEEEPGLMYAFLVSGGGLNRNNTDYSLKLEYNVSKLGDFSFYWMKLGEENKERPGVSAKLNLKKYNYLSFWVKGAKGGEKLKVELHEDINNDGVFTFEKDKTAYLYLDAYLPNGSMAERWQKVLIPLKDFKVIKNWSKMLELVFVVENRLGNKTGGIYLDDIIFGYRPEDILDAQKTKQIEAPIEASFKINGQSVTKQPVFTESNVLSIEAESIKENPFIESVSFQYSEDSGKTWKLINADYNVNKNKYEAVWRPRRSCSELYKYQIKAEACGIRGNRKTTDVLIDCAVNALTDEEFLDLLEQKAFEFFDEHQDPATGLFADTSGGGDASTASTGFGLAALCAGAERGWIAKKEAKKRVLTALNSFVPTSKNKGALVEGKDGFFYHFIDIKSGKRAGKSEVSTVDTAILIAGILTAGEYFGGEVREKAEKIYKNIEWDTFVCKDKKSPFYNMFSLGWTPESGYDPIFWDFYTDEVILISLLAIGSPTYPVDPEVFYSWGRYEASYGDGAPFIYTWHGALFAHQYANIFFDFRNIADKKGVNWFENSKKATIANRQFCLNNADKFKTFGPNTWGITSMLRPSGYTMHFGASPAGSAMPEYDATISPTAASGSIVFTPDISIATLKYMFSNYPKLWGEYGLKDSFNLDMNWYAPIYYGISEALIVLPIENFRSGLIWKNFMKSKFVKEGLQKAGFIKQKN